MLIREVQDGERLSGHKRDSQGNYPEIMVSDHTQGSMMVAFASFQWADVKVHTNDRVELWFEGKTCITIENGYVEYADPHTADPAETQIVQ